MEPEPLLEIDSLAVTYRSARRRGNTRAVDGVSLRLLPGETLGLVGESGSGKTSMGAAVVGLAPVTGGTIRYRREDITRATASRRRDLSAQIQVIFQDPYSSLNPSRTVAQTLVEPLLVHSRLTRSESRQQVRAMLENVGLDGAAADRYPRQFSGGQRQRIAIARALIISPQLVICDEPVSALDLSVQAQVLNLLLALQEQLSLSYLFIAHDLAVVRHISQRIAVMYRGRIMESGDAETVYGTPGHPYTVTLLAANPIPDPGEQRRKRSLAVTRRPARPHVATTSGCPFAARCPLTIDICVSKAPELVPGPSGALVACHRRDEVHSLADDDRAVEPQVHRESQWSIPPER
jgi:oligopeptide/dipeptide ABC transporter ATP-binding protein